MNDAEFRDMLDATPPLVLTASRMKSLGLLLGSCIFVIGGIWGLFHGMPLLIAYSSIIFFGLGVLVALTMICIPTLTAVTLQTDDFSITSAFGRKHTYKWNAVSVFVSQSIQIDLTRIEGVYFDEGSTSERAELNRSLTGFSAMLPLGYKLSPPQLAQLMNHWRERAQHQNR